MTVSPASLSRLFILVLVGALFLTQASGFRAAHSLVHRRAITSNAKFSITDISIALADGLNAETLNALGDTQNLDEAIEVGVDTTASVSDLLTRLVASPGN